MNSIEILLGGKIKRRKAVNSDYIEFYDKNGEMVATCKKRRSKNKCGLRRKQFRLKSINDKQTR